MHLFGPGSAQALHHDVDNREQDADADEAWRADAVREFHHVVGDRLHEAARVLAEKAMKEGGASAPSRLAWTFRQILSREPSEHELKLLVDGFERRRQAYESRKVDAEKLLKLGEIPYDNSLVPTELAAFTATTSLIYNLDEFVAKP